LVQATPIRQVDPNHSYLLCNKEAMGSIPSMDHGDRISQPIGHLGQAELQAALMVLSYHTQVAVEMIIPQDIGEAVVLVRKVEKMAEAGAIFFMGPPEATVIG
jgi:hypothetical protein